MVDQLLYQKTPQKIIFNIKDSTKTKINVKVLTLLSASNLIYS